MARRPVNAPFSITTEFGVPDQYAKFSRHSGVDYAVPLNRPVYAPVSGTLTNIVSATGGNMVQIFDGKYYHRLMHNNSFSRANGYVKEGEEVAKAGTTGLSTGVHVHWDIADRANPTAFNQFVSPAAFLANPPANNNEGEDIVKPTYTEVLDSFRAYLGRDCTKTEQDKYVTLDKRVLYKDLLDKQAPNWPFLRDRYNESNAKYEPVNEQLYRRK